MHKLLKNKKIVFLDGDGTIWYPEKTRRTMAPHWVYKDDKIDGSFLEHLIIIPTVVETLKKLKQQGIALILISTHPHPQEEADVLLNNKVKHFKLEDVFDGIYTARDYPEEKGEIMNDILKLKAIPASQALMIGDSHKYDYLSAKSVGIEAILMDSEYLNSQGSEVEKITDLSELDTTGKPVA